MKKIFCNIIFLLMAMAFATTTNAQNTLQYTIEHVKAKSFLGDKVYENVEASGTVTVNLKAKKFVLNATYANEEKTSYVVTGTLEDEPKMIDNFGEMIPNPILEKEPDVKEEYVFKLIEFDDKPDEGWFYITEYYNGKIVIEMGFNDDPVVLYYNVKKI